MNEGFFADVVVLVEGEDDRAAILGYASADGIDLDSEGIAVIPCGGKRNLDRPYVIFHQLGIPAYVLFDGDQESKDPKPEDNRYLLRLLGQPEQDWPDSVAPTFACFRVDLEDTLEQELGEANLGRLTEEIKAEFGISKNEDARKRPVVFRRLVEKAKSESLEIPSLKRIVDSIRALRHTT
jgi:predicted ATP-dependent endonuclease of OLD family